MILGLGSPYNMSSTRMSPPIKHFACATKSTKGGWTFGVPASYSRAVERCQLRTNGSVGVVTVITMMVASGPPLCKVNAAAETVSNPHRPSHIPVETPARKCPAAFVSSVTARWAGLRSLQPQHSLFHHWTLSSSHIFLLSFLCLTDTYIASYQVSRPRRRTPTDTQLNPQCCVIPTLFATTTATEDLLQTRRREQVGCDNSSRLPLEPRKRENIVYLSSG
jgi:hypothetical protein